MVLRCVTLSRAGERVQTMLRPLLGEGIFNADGAHWLNQRKMAAQMFSAREVLLALRGGECFHCGCCEELLALLLFVLLGLFGRCWRWLRASRGGKHNLNDGSRRCGLSVDAAARTERTMFGV